RDVVIDLSPLLGREEAPGGLVHAPKSLQILSARLATLKRWLIDHQEALRRLVDSFEQTAFFLRLQVVNRKAAPGCIGPLWPLGQSLDEVFLVELDLEGDGREVFRRKLKRWHGEVDALVMATPGAGQNFAHLTRVATGDIE